jgi:threonine dehydrogenase-like Zn-dependent dehydrogenase
VLSGRIHPGRVFTASFPLERAADAYAAMDRREAIKSLLVVS